MKREVSCACRGARNALERKIWIRKRISDFNNRNRSETISEINFNYETLNLPFSSLNKCLQMEIALSPLFDDEFFYVRLCVSTRQLREAQ